MRCIHLDKKVLLFPTVTKVTAMRLSEFKAAFKMNCLKNNMVDEVPGPDGKPQLTILGRPLDATIELCHLLVQTEPLSDMDILWRYIRRNAELQDQLNDANEKLSNIRRTLNTK